MPKAAASRFRLVLRATGLLLLMLVSVALAVAAFFAAALVVDAPLTAALGAALVLLTATFACAWWRAPVLGWAVPRRLPFAGVLSAVTVGAVAAGAWSFVFQPLDAGKAALAPADDVAAWALPTGSRLAYTAVRARGPARPTPLVYLHGGPAVPPRGSVFAFLAPLADDGFDIYIYDQFGSGRSSRAGHIGDYTLERHVADLEAVRRALGAEQLVLVGSSWGAVLAGHYMAAHPTRVERAVLLSPGVLTDRQAHRYDFSRTASADDPNVLLPPLRMIVAGTLARLNPTLAQSFASQDELGAVFDGFTAGPGLEYQSHCKGSHVPAARSGRPSRAAGGNYYANLLTMQSLRRAPDPRPALQGVTAPVLLLRGDCDHVPWSSALAWQHALPGATLVRMADAGHALISSAPEASFTLLRDFIVRGDKPDGPGLRSP